MCPSKEEIIKAVFGHSINKNIIGHLKDCVTCMEIYNEYKTLWNDLVQLQEVSPPEISHKFIKTIVAKTNMTYHIYRGALYIIFYLIIAIPIFIYFYHIESEKIDYGNLSISQLLDPALVKKYHHNTLKMLRNYYQRKWFAGSINNLLASYRNNINQTYIHYFNPFIEKLVNISENNIFSFTKDFKSIYEISILSYFVSQELKIKKILYGQSDLVGEKLLHNLLSYLMFSQNSDGGFGILPKDEKSLQQTLFWIALFIKNYIVLTNTIPHNIIEKIERYVSNKTDVISNFVKYYLFNQQSNFNENPAHFIYIEQILAYLFITKDYKHLVKENIILFL